MDDTQVFALAASNRRLAADMFAGLGEEQWATASLCEGWTVREVCAHMTPPASDVGVLGLVGMLVRHRGDLHRMVDATARADATAPTATLVARLRERADRTFAPPGIGALGPLTDSAIHLRDAARPLGLDVCPPPSHWRPVLDFLTGPRARRGFVRRGRLDGLRLAATDQDWAWGTGVEVSGPSEALALAAAGRAVALTDLTGPGVAVLASRVGTS